MSHALNGTGTAHNGSATLSPPVPPPTPNPGLKESFVTFKSADGASLRGALGRMTRHSATFEIYSPNVVLSTSEALTEFSIQFQGQAIYSGRAIIRSLVDAGAKVVCEVTLDEAQWSKVKAELLTKSSGHIADEFKEFLCEWQKYYIISPEFKVVVADMQTFLHDLQTWLDRVEIEIRATAPTKRKEIEQKVMHDVGSLFVPAFDVLHEKLEALSQKISGDLRPAHRAFIQRQLHPLMLCSPFGHRAYAKPLGYAGDYEMVNMIALDPYQGQTLFSKMVNLWFLSQWPSKAHRNRLSYLKNLLENETLRIHRKNGTTKIFNFACGPALEIQRYLSEFAPSEKASLTLSDFNQETLDRLQLIISDIKKSRTRKTQIKFLKKSVYQLFKETHKLADQKSKYDLVYCAGLFDYLPDSTCAQLMEIFYDWLAPGGLLAVTNVVDDKPFRHMLEFVLDWNLIYRDVKDSAAIFPDSIPVEVRSIKKDPTGVNIFIEARKPCE